MLERLFVVIVSFFAFYGFTCLIFTWIEVQKRQKINRLMGRCKIKLVIYLKDVVNDVEDIIRYLENENSLYNVIGDNKPIIVDLGSIDGTRDILEIIKRKSEKIDVIYIEETEDGAIF